jgi:uncharacterized protein YcaQ
MHHTVLGGIPQRGEKTSREVEKIEKTLASISTLTHEYLFFPMDFYKRNKKSDKAKEKAGRPSQKHVRQYEAIMEKRSQEVKKHDPNRQNELCPQGH